MALLLKGQPVAAALDEETALRAGRLSDQGVLPTLAIVRVGAREDDLSYERSAMKRCAKLGIAVQNVVFEETIDPDTFFHTLHEINENPAVHGILLFRPLPAGLDGEKARRMICPDKDVDGCTDGSLAGVFTNTAVGFAPCTAQAAMEICRFYGIDPCGKRCVIIGRSLVIGRPVAMMMMHANATVTICHTRTRDISSVIREADIVVCASGQLRSIGAESLCPGQVVIDVGIGWSEELQKLCGDVRTEEAEPVVAAVTPVPGGVGSVTTSMLARHVVEAAERRQV